ncbi:dicarboxylate/amino acid:cation symporter [Yinghuangia sp. ASG 101]|uniref:dicarboxylate/amino acid:cation symporter n=1 Tax=Yinghuangia sp. ASG 101 TaxID=2896848 RepID=UPI001E4DBECC|nr:dicarboxylate/amino acid:cation symporter [Yinghuangia sp. ASG 101]UGQ15423.1 dicarboxylate/amino acid:cation symporter [Yinghuangia sp. ASG 101]
MSRSSESPTPAAARPRGRRLPRIPFWAQTFIGLAVGVALGFLAREANVDWLGTTLDEVGSMFVRLLKLAVPPLVFTAVLVSVANLRNVNNAASLALRTLGWFLATSLIAVAVGITLGVLTDPGKGVDLQPGELPEGLSNGDWLDFLTGIVPTNIVEAFGPSPKVLQIVFLAIVVGAAVLSVGKKAEPLVNAAEIVLEVVQKALWWVIRLSPLGTAGLIGNAVATYGWDSLKPLGTFTVDIYVGCAIVLFVVYPLLLAGAARVNPLRFFQGAWPAIQLGFVSRSSVGTMPVTQSSAERLGVPKDYASFAVPFGATTKMDGCAAIYPSLAAIFVAQYFGVDLGLKDYFLIVLVSVIGSAATAGLTGAIVMLTLTLDTVGLPLAGVGLLLAIDPILDMMRTATNVAGQVAVPVLVSARDKTLDLDKYNNPRDIDSPDDDPSDPVDTTKPVPAQPDHREPVSA